MIWWPFVQGVRRADWTRGERQDPRGRRARGLSRCLTSLYRQTAVVSLPASAFAKAPAFAEAPADKPAGKPADRPADKSAGRLWLSPNSCAALKRAAPALAVRDRLPRSGKPSRLIPSLTLAPAASTDARGRQMSGAQMRRWWCGIYADHRDRTRREESPRRLPRSAVLR